MSFCGVSDDKNNGINFFVFSKTHFDPELAPNVILMVELVPHHIRVHCSTVHYILIILRYKSNHKIKKDD